jgi:hypothetical protein
MQVINSDDATIMDGSEIIYEEPVMPASATSSATKKQPQHWWERKWWTSHSRSADEK